MSTTYATTNDLVMSANAKNKCYEYSEDVAKLEKVLTDPSFSFKVKFQGTRKYFPTDKEEREVLEFTLSYKGKVYSDTFGMSIHDTKVKQIKDSINRDEYSFGGSLSKRMNAREEWVKIVEGLLYSILCCLNTYIPEDYKDFCDEFGYDEGYAYDGMNTTVLKIWQDSRKQYLTCKSMFGEDYTEYFPR